jgi:hypothetical protein
MKLNKYILFFILYFSNNLFAQYDLNFIRYLSENQLKNEHFTYLSKYDKQDNFDSLAYLKSKFHLQYSNDSLFLESFNSSISICQSDTLLMNNASIHFLKSTNQNREKWFKSEGFKGVSTISKFCDSLYFSTIEPSKKKIDLLPDELKLDYINYCKYYKKSPLLAATFSTLIPGLGQLYIGNFRSFMTRISTQALFAFQFLESKKKLGIFHPISILNASFYSVFYSVNIVGTYRDTNEKKEEFKNQFLINASNYLSNTIYLPLY